MEISKTYYKFLVGFLGIILVAVISYLIWNEYFSAAARLSRQLQKQYEQALQYQQDYEETMRKDTYGGKTPEETLKLFIEALKKEDVELASKYFLLDENLSREKWINFLKQLKERGYLLRLADDITKEAKPVGSLYNGNFQFKLYNNDGTTGLLIDMQFNRYSQVWKIESL